MLIFFRGFSSKTTQVIASLNSTLFCPLKKIKQNKKIIKKKKIMKTSCDHQYHQQSKQLHFCSFTGISEYIQILLSAKTSTRRPAEGYKFSVGRGQMSGVRFLWLFSCIFCSFAISTISPSFVLVT